MSPDLKTFDGLDNRREVMRLLERLGTDEQRARFIASLMHLPKRTLVGCKGSVQGKCDSVTAYFMLVSVCNDLGISIEQAAKKLEAKVNMINWGRSGYSK